MQLFACEKTPDDELEQGGQTFSVKGPPINILGFAGHIVAIANTQLCCCNMKAARDNTQLDGYGCVPVKLYF